jgi:hypothetical protein
MTDGAFNEFWLVLTVAPLAEGVGGIFKGGDFIRQTRLAVMAGFAFFNFLAINVCKALAFGTLAMMTSSAFQSSLVLAMGELRRLSRFCRVNG